ncbi:MAG TPA: sulfurtransferase TusA family protein [Dehalococcoidia bacterium]|nr:sulfurtransferase TusA family protein [Dehalococcoidia bacterium]
MHEDVNDTGDEHRRMGEALIAAVVKRDFAALEACFHPEIRFRALVPPGVREATGAQDAVAYFQRWFGDADQLELLESDAGTLADRLHVRYRFLVVDADGRQTVEQQAYGDLQDGKLVRLDLLCSGFRPFLAPGQAAVPAAVLDAIGATCATLTPLIQRTMRTLASGQVLEVCADEPEACEGIAAWSRLTGNALLATVEEETGRTRFYLRKRT